LGSSLRRPQTASCRVWNLGCSMASAVVSRRFRARRRRPSDSVSPRRVAMRTATDRSSLSRRALVPGRRLSSRPSCRLGRRLAPTPLVRPFLDSYPTRHRRHHQLWPHDFIYPALAIRRSVRHLTARRGMAAQAMPTADRWSLRGSIPRWRSSPAARPSRMRHTSFCASTSRRR
jgi:hypothetical protein